MTIATGIFLSAILSVPINERVGRAAEGGGGVVVVPAGLWEQNGPICLKSNVELRLSEGAVVEFTDRLSDYLPGVPVSWEGVECVNVSPLIYAYGCTNIAITGKGTFKVKLDFWIGWSGVRKTACEAINRKLKNEWAVKGVPVAERRICDQAGAEFRPHLLHFNRCRNIRLEDFKVKGTPFWTLHLFLCDGAIVRGLDINAFDDKGRVLNNSDGIDIDSSKNVLVESCSFRQGDDAIVLKSGKDHDGRRLATSTENVTIRDCIVHEGHVLVAVGSELSGGIRNVTVENCRVKGCVNRLFYVKTNPRRGGLVDGFTMKNIVANEVRDDAFAVVARYFYGCPGEEPLSDGEFYTAIRRLSFRNVTCAKADRRICIAGDSHCPVTDVDIENVEVGECAKTDEIVNAKGVSIDGKVVESIMKETDGPQY